MENMTLKQMELMRTVPHPLTPSGAVLSSDAIKIIDNLMKFINACGRKPWRPNPLPDNEIGQYLTEFLTSATGIAQDYIDKTGVENDPKLNRLMVSSLGIIEESIETFNESQASPIDRPAMLTEQTDMIFFYLEMMIELGFTWKDIQEEYYRKWEINMKRYSDALKGDFSWDRRADGSL